MPGAPLRGGAAVCPLTGNEGACVCGSEYVCVCVRGKVGLDEGQHDTSIACAPKEYRSGVACACLSLKPHKDKNPSQHRPASLDAEGIFFYRMHKLYSSSASLTIKNTVMWPACSPDLSVIEDVLHLMKGRTLSLFFRSKNNRKVYSLN